MMTTKIMFMLMMMIISGDLLWMILPFCGQLVHCHCHCQCIEGAVPMQCNAVPNSAKGQCGASAYGHNLHSTECVSSKSTVQYTQCRSAVHKVQIRKAMQSRKAVHKQGSAESAMASPPDGKWPSHTFAFSLMYKMMIIINHGWFCSIKDATNIGQGLKRVFDIQVFLLITAT